MTAHCHWMRWIVVGIVASLNAGAAAQSAAAKLNEAGAEARALATQVGTWDVVETVWATPDAKPVITKAVAVRRMIGAFLEEVLHPADDASDAAIGRIDYLHFNRVEGRWNYVSMETRAPVGVMTANSFERDPAENIEVVFSPFALPGDGAAVSGQLLRMTQIIETLGPDAGRKDQHFIVADGTGRKWLAHRYEYTRRPAGPAQQGHGPSSDARARPARK